MRLSHDLVRSISWRFREFRKNRLQEFIWLDPNRRVRKETRTDMESVTFEMLETTVDVTVLILFDVIKSSKRYCSTTILVTSPDSPVMAATSNPVGECVAPYSVAILGIEVCGIHLWILECMFKVNTHSMETINRNVRHMVSVSDLWRVGGNSDMSRLNISCDRELFISCFGSFFCFLAGHKSSS